MHDYLVASLIGVPLGLFVGLIAGIFAGANWGPHIAIVIVLGLFLTTSAGFVASYLNFRFHQMSENKKMAGFSAGLFTAVVYTFIILIAAVVESIADTPGAATFFISWIIEAVFAFVFMSLGGYLEGMFESRPFVMPGIFNMEKVQPLPPPPPTANIANCPICGRPMRFIEQYNRWYCDYDKKYA